MNIDKIYKPIESFCVGIHDNTNQFVCLSEEVKDLEEKYKEILEALIYCLDEKVRKVNNYKTEQYVKSIIESVTGVKWENL